VKNEQGTVDGLGQRAGEDKFAAFAGFSGEAQVLFAERDAARDHVINEFIEQGVVVHRVSPVILDESRVAEIAA
jgi:hypothetical protein